MYIPSSFAETDLATLQTFMQQHNFAVLFSSHTQQPLATHLPFMLDTTRGTYGALVAHFARANPHWQHLSADHEVLVVFQGDHTYISPKWYNTPSVVPTWNYATVHAYGSVKIIHEAEPLKAMLMQLVNAHDQVPHLEAQFPDNLLQAIVGIEILLTRLEGKFKFSQNKPLADQQQVVAALRQSKSDVDHRVAEIMQKNIDAAVK